MDKPCCIYLLTDRTGIRYVGVSVNPKLRLKHHMYEALDKTRRMYHFPKSRWIRKHKGEIRLRVLWRGTETDCYRKESLVIDECRRRGHRMLNLAEGGHRPPRINTLPNYDAIRRKISTSASRRTMSKETRAKMSAAHVGKPTHVSRFKGRRQNSDHPTNKAVVQCDLNGNVIAVHASGRIAANAIGVKPCTICDVLKGRQKTSAGFTWRYA